MTNTMFRRVALVLSVFALVLSAPAHASKNLDALQKLKALNARLVQKKATVSHRPPKAYMRFCARNASECRGGGASQVRLSKRLLNKLYRTNRSVNRKIRYRNDRGDSWNLASRYGDCEDYALTKRSELIRKGVPAGALRMAVVKTRKGIGHAVLVVRTNRGDLVLDNRRSSIRKRQNTGYRYIAMATHNPKRWVSKF